MRYLAGLDLGQSHDYTALTIAECASPVSQQPHVEVWGLPAPTTQPAAATYAVRHVERFRLNTAYPGIVVAVKDRLATLVQQSHTAQLVVDATGVGAPVVDMFKAAQLPCDLYAIHIHGGDAVTHAGRDYRVPKRDLVSVVQVLLQSGRLKIAESLQNAKLLVQELLNFQMKLHPLTAHDSYNAREGQHDDLVLSVALAVWCGEHGPPPLDCW